MMNFNLDFYGVDVEYSTRWSLIETLLRHSRSR